MLAVPRENAMSEQEQEKRRSRKRSSGIPTGHAGEYFVMGELLRRGYDAQLADPKTNGYSILLGKPGDEVLRKMQVKSVRSPPWLVKTASFREPLLDQVTIYVLVGNADAKNPVRYFVTRNKDLVPKMMMPRAWQDNAFMLLHFVEEFED